MMSKSRNISYVKPQDPSFLAKLKAQIGWETTTIEAKKQRLEDLDQNSGIGEEDQFEGREDEKPQIVVLKSGDLTAEEVAKEEERIAREAAETRADLSKPVVFQKRKAKNSSEDKTVVPSKKSKKKESAKRENKVKLSFHDNEDEEEDGDKDEDDEAKDFK